VAGASGRPLSTLQRARRAECASRQQQQSVVCGSKSVGRVQPGTSSPVVEQVGMHSCGIIISVHCAVGTAEL
jgi:hypothetical protein